MPGMMDTVLNLGLNDESVSRSPKTGNERFARTTPTAGSSTCSATSSWASTTTLFETEIDDQEARGRRGER